MEKRQQPIWNPPEQVNGVSLPELYLENSLTSRKERFIPQDGKQVTWYSCGPTVYDSSHMGHARTYIAFDILRRVMQDYFGFKVRYVMNITDIDDKIIMRARQKYLLEQFSKESHELADIQKKLAQCIDMTREKSLKDPEPLKRDYFSKECERLGQLLAQASNLKSDEIISQAKDAFASLIDKERGSSVSDCKIFEALPRYYEQEFHQDMAALNILNPDELVRVSECIQPIVDFIERIIVNGFAYSVPSGSVYFNTAKFAIDPKHFYAKLVPTAFGDKNQLATGEGDLAGHQTEKANPNDFALWKASKPGEPAWDSPWGKGRPGWHIECSAMATGALGDSMDIHSGGVDLKFPHHDNELAQSEAFHGHSHWVRYFLHSGHLTIEGAKMSKSLKNFVTIREALKQHTARQLRLVFLLHNWRDTLDYSAKSMAEACSLDKSFHDFTFNVSHLVYLASSEKRAVQSDQPSQLVCEVRLAREKCIRAVYAALCDSIDTRGAMWALRELIMACNTAQMTDPLQSQHVHLVQATKELIKAAALVLRLLRMFGVADNTAISSPRMPTTSEDEKDLSWDVLPWISMDALTKKRLDEVHAGLIQASDRFMQKLGSSALPDSVLAGYEKPQVRNWSGQELEQLWPLLARDLHALAEFRQRVRAFGQEQDPGEVKKTVLQACDCLRDEYLPPLGVRLQDRAVSGASNQQMADVPAIGLIDPAIFQEEDEERRLKEQERAAKQAAKDEQGKISPKEMFLQDRDQYSHWDDMGMPTHDLEGKELAKSRLKKLAKLYEVQTKKHEAYLKSQEAKK